MQGKLFYVLFIVQYFLSNWRCFPFCMRYANKIKKIFWNIWRQKKKILKKKNGLLCFFLLLWNKSRSFSLKKKINKVMIFFSKIHITYQRLFTFDCAIKIKLRKSEIKNISEWKKSWIIRFVMSIFIFGCNAKNSWT